MVDGSVIKGKLLSQTDNEITVDGMIGTVTLRKAQITGESLRQLGVGMAEFQSSAPKSASNLPAAPNDKAKRDLSQLSGDALLRELVARLEQLEAHLASVEITADSRNEALRESTRAALELLEKRLPESPEPKRQRIVETAQKATSPVDQLAAWRSLHSSMSQDDVRQTLGEPASARIDSPNEYWTFTSGGKVRFYSNKLYDWTSP